MGSGPLRREQSTGAGTRTPNRGDTHPCGATLPLPPGAREGGGVQRGAGPRGWRDMSPGSRPSTMAVSVAASETTASHSRKVSPSAAQTPSPAAVMVAPVAADGVPNVSFWDVLGRNAQDRFGAVLIAAGTLAVLYAVLTQIRFS